MEVGVTVCVCACVRETFCLYMFVSKLQICINGLSSANRNAPLLAHIRNIFAAETVPKSCLQCFDIVVWASSKTSRSSKTKTYSWGEPWKARLLKNRVCVCPRKTLAKCALDPTTHDMDSVLDSQNTVCLSTLYTVGVQRHLQHHAIYGCIILCRAGNRHAIKQ